jgi:predicted secreted protein
VFTPTANLASGNASITVTANSYQDAAGNNGTAGNTPGISIDSLAPSVLISSSTSALKIGETATLTFTFSEDPISSFVWNGSAGDVVVTGGSLGAISGTGLTRTAVFTPTASLASGSASISVTGNSYADAAGNLGTTGLSPSISIDTLAPAVTSVALTGATGDVNQRLNAGDTLSATLTFNDVVTLNTAGGSPTLAFLVGSSTVLATYVSGSGTNALVFSTIIINGQTDTDGVAMALNALNLNGATLKDSAGNNSVITSSAVSSNSNYLVDTTAPTVAVTSSATSLKAGDTATITFTFSEDPGTSFTWDGSAGDVVASGGTLGAISGTGTTRTAVFTPTPGLASGTGSISVTANSYQDSAGNNGDADTPPSISIDTLAPSLLITSSISTLKASETSTITFTFSEDPGSSFTWNGSAGDVAVTGGSLGAISGTGLTRAALFTPTANLAIGNASITVAADTYQDNAGNNGRAGSTPTISIDTLAPTVNSVALSGSSGSQNQRLNAGDTLNATLTFDDAVTLNLDGGSPTLALVIGGTNVQATYVSGSSTNALVFSTTIISGQTDTDEIGRASCRERVCQYV